MAMKILTQQELALYLKTEHDPRTVKNDFTKHSVLWSLAALGCP